jgi:hypothetical protein
VTARPSGGFHTSNVRPPGAPGECGFPARCGEVSRTASARNPRGRRGREAGPARRRPPAP